MPAPTRSASAVHTARRCGSSSESGDPATRAVSTLAASAPLKVTGPGLEQRLVRVVIDDVGREGDGELAQRCHDLGDTRRVDHLDDVEGDPGERLGLEGERLRSTHGVGLGEREAIITEPERAVTGGRQHDNAATDTVRGEDERHDRREHTGVVDDADQRRGRHGETELRQRARRLTPGA